MYKTTRFSLETHSGAYDSWPTRSCLIVDGTRSNLPVAGYIVQRQYETAAGYLLITNFDCPFEEAVSFVLIARDLSRVLAERTIAVTYSSVHLVDVAWIDEWHFSVTFAGMRGEWMFKIRRWSLPLIRSRFEMKRIR
ncbi:hypothetical protein GD429_38755 [Burkholderia sp. BE17]|nr:hypothetical protein [Burkholderia sp. BE17]